MQTDRELLEAAAQAAGHKLADEVDSHMPSGALLIVGRGGRYALWNPLHDDGDALHLAVNLRISLIHEQEYMGGSVMETIAPAAADGTRHCEAECLNGLTDDPMANTRRAIVRAAASLATQTPAQTPKEDAASRQPGDDKS